MDYAVWMKCVKHKGEGNVMDDVCSITRNHYVTDIATLGDGLGIEGRVLPGLPAGDRIRLTISQ